MRTKLTFVLCLSNDGYKVSLEPRKLYPVLQDRDAEAHGQLRIVDESGEDYLYPKSLFTSIKLKPAVRKAFARAV